VNDRIFVPSESYKPDLTRSFGLFQRLQRPARRKETVRILQSDILVKLHQVDMVRLQPPQRLVDLSRRRFLGAAVELRHQEDLFPASVPKRLAHHHFALSTVVACDAFGAGTYGIGPDSILRGSGLPSGNSGPMSSPPSAPTLRPRSGPNRKQDMRLAGPKDGGLV
jgi:hypothetical protein